MKSTPYLSSYLALESSELTHPSGWSRRFRNRLVIIWRTRPNLSLRNWIALVLWSGIFAVGLFTFSTPGRLPNHTAIIAADHGKIADPNPVGAKTAIHLPSGPTGQLLPPGTLAPAYTYKNSYSRGQCTWYVAGRRPIPGNWGHARTWLAAAQRAGWTTGTAPATGAIAWTSRGYYGHVALVEGVNTTTGQVLVSEMNFVAPYRITQRWTTISDFKYIY